MGKRPQADRLVDQIRNPPPQPQIASPIHNDPPAKRPRKKVIDAVPVDEAAALGPARHIRMTIFAQDPNVMTPDRKILRARVKVSADRFRRPFQTHRFHVVSFDPERAAPDKPFALLDEQDQFHDKFAELDDDALLGSHDFHAQNVFAIANRTLAAFEGGLGRRVPWDFESHQLYLVPHGEIRANAFYSNIKRALIFGLVPDEKGRNLYSCLSHDIIAHETTHAVLDGLRPGYFTAGLPDQGAFHEGFADIVALLSVFAVPSVAEEALGRVDSDQLLSASQVTAPKLKDSFVLQLAEQFGVAVHGRRGLPLRESVKLSPDIDWEHDPSFNEVHNRGEVIVAAVANAFLNMWLGRLAELFRPGKASRTLAAEEGAKAAEHLLNMAIRAIDYLPPIEFEFADFLEAILVSDAELVPDDDHGYRKSVEAAFNMFRINRPPRAIVEVTKLKVRPNYERFNFAALRSQPDEVFRFLWENDELLGVNLAFETFIESVRPSIRVGPDGFVTQEAVVTYLQHLRGTIADLQELSTDAAMRYGKTTATLLVPPDIDVGTNLDIWGGGALIFDQFGRPKWHQHKPLLDWDRQTRRLAYLAKTTEPNSAGVIGGRPSDRSEPLAALHHPERYGTERW